MYVMLTGMRRSQMRDDVKMLNDVFNVFLSNVRGDVTLAYPNFCKAYPCRVYKASKYISRIEQKDNGGSMPRLGYEFRKKALPAGSALEDDEHSFEDLSYVEGAIKSRTYEKELAASTFNHVILFVSEDEQTGCNSFRSRHFRSIPDQVVLDLGLFDDDGLTVDQRLGRFEYVDRSMVLERRVMCSVFMKSPKGEDE